MTHGETPLKRWIWFGSFLGGMILFLSDFFLRCNFSPKPQTNTISVSQERCCFNRIFEHSGKPKNSPPPKKPQKNHPYFWANTHPSQLYHELITIRQNPAIWEKIPVIRDNVKMVDQRKPFRALSWFSIFYQCSRTCADDDPTQIPFPNSPTGRAGMVPPQSPVPFVQYKFRWPMQYG